MENRAPRWPCFLPFLTSQVCFAQSHGVQHLGPGQTSSSGPPSPSAPPQGAVRAARGPAYCFNHARRASTLSLFPLLPSQGCLGSSVHCTSQIIPPSSFNLSTHHCSSLEQKEPEIAASREAQPPWARGGVKSNGFCRDWCSPSHRQEVHPWILGDDSAMVEGGLSHSPRPRPQEPGLALP